MLLDRLVSPLGAGEAGPLLHGRWAPKGVSGAWSSGPQVHPFILRFNQNWASMVSSVQCLCRGCTLGSSTDR